jgi:hypothetical protein
MHMDWADKDYGVHEDAVHVQAENGSGTVEGMVGIAGSAATCTAAPNWEERPVEIAVGWEADLRAVLQQVAQEDEAAYRD